MKFKYVDSHLLYNVTCNISFNRLTKGHLKFKYPYVVLVVAFKIIYIKSVPKMFLLQLITL